MMKADKGEGEKDREREKRQAASVRGDRAHARERKEGERWKREEKKRRKKKASVRETGYKAERERMEEWSALICTCHLTDGDWW